MPSVSPVSRFSLLRAMISDLSDMSESDDCDSFCEESLLINTAVYDFGE